MEFLLHYQINLIFAYKKAIYDRKSTIRGSYKKHYRQESTSKYLKERKNLSINSLKSEKSSSLGKMTIYRIVFYIHDYVSIFDPGHVSNITEIESQYSTEFHTLLVLGYNLTMKHGLLFEL